MSTFRKTLSCFLSLVLSFSLMGIPAYGVELTGEDSALEGQNEVTKVDENSVQAPADVVEQSADSSIVQSQEAAAPVDEATIQQDARDVIGFVYVDRSIVSIDEKQSIVVAFMDEGLEFAQAQLTIKNLDRDTNELVDYSVASEGALLFEIDYERGAEAAYQVVGLTYSLQGDEQTYFIDFANAADEENSYIFDVVSTDLAETLDNAAPEEVAGEEGVTTSAFVIDSDGQMTPADSVDEAIQIADAEKACQLETTEAATNAPYINNESAESSDEEVAQPESSVNVQEPAITFDSAGVREAPALEEFPALEPATQDEAQDSAKPQEKAPSIQQMIDGFFQWIGSIFGMKEAYAASISTTREDYLVVAIDPGHGGSDPGASGPGGIESSVNLSISQHMKDRLDSEYTGVSAYMTRTSDVYVGLTERVNRAVTVGADVFVCIHCNASGSGGRGAEVWVPNESSYYYQEAHVTGYQLGQKILKRLVNLGLSDRGVKDRNCTTGERYPGGGIEDYYTVINASRYEGIPGIIVEHAFIDSASDAQYLNSDSARKKLGIADADGVAEQYRLGSDSVARSSSLLAAQGHSSYIGWLDTVYDNKVIGTTGHGIRLQAFKLNLTNSAASAGGIQYRSNVDGAWQNWVNDGAQSGTTGQDKPIQAIEIKLTGNAANQFDVYYRAHVANVGWMGWAKNGETAGTGLPSNALEAIEVYLAPKTLPVLGATGSTGSTGSTSAAYDPGKGVYYQAHVQNIGWQSQVGNGATAGTTGRGLRVEALRVEVHNMEYAGTIEMNSHVQNIGWQGYKAQGQVSGTSGMAYRVEAIQLRLTGALAEQYDVYYRVHAQNIGWMGWAKNGESAGTEGYALRLEGIEIQLVRKGNAAPGQVSDAFRCKSGVFYSTHVQNDGWQSEKGNGEVAGTTGRALRLEGIEIYTKNLAVSGGIQYATHVQNIGWQNWKYDGAMSGTSGRSLRLEAIQIALTGAAADRYDVYYRVHAQNIGWMGWAKNGESSGTAGYSYRLEGIQIMLVDKGGAAPVNNGDTSTAFVDRNQTETSIMGSPRTNAAQMARYYKSTGASYPSSTYSSKGAASIDQFCQIAYEEAVAEGVRPEVLFCQAMKETGWLKFGGQVSVSQCNFGGFRNGDAGFYTFPDVRTGLRAQAQHLKAYASTAALNNTCVDPRFNLVTRGIAPNLEDLNGRWAVGAGSGNYGQTIADMIKTLLTK